MPVRCVGAWNAVMTSSISFHPSHTLHTQNITVYISCVFECVVSLSWISWPMKLFGLDYSSPSLHHVKPHMHTHTHTQNGNIVLLLFWETPETGQEAGFWVKPCAGAGEKEGGLWHQKKLGSLVTVTWGRFTGLVTRTHLHTCTHSQNSSRPLQCTLPPPTHTNKLIKAHSGTNTHTQGFSYFNQRWKMTEQINISNKPLKKKTGALVSYMQYFILKINHDNRAFSLKFLQLRLKTGREIQNKQHKTMARNWENWQFVTVLSRGNTKQDKL